MKETLEKITNNVISKKITIAVASYLLGLTTGAIGKECGGDLQYVIPAVLPGMDLMAGRINPYVLPYAFGVITNYL